MKYYRVWLVDQNLNEYPIFEKIDDNTLKTWLSNAAECYSGTWWINPDDSENAAHGIPYNPHGYVVKNEEV